MKAVVSAFPFFFFFNDTATTEIYTLSLHDALPICCLALPLDVTDAAAVDAAAQAVLAHAGGAPDLILYCAGHYRPLRATEFDLAEMQHHLAVNYGGVLHLLRSEERRVGKESRSRWS